jgi:hypothetical protein
MTTSLFESLYAIVQLVICIFPWPSIRAFQSHSLAFKNSQCLTPPDIKSWDRLHGTRGEDNMYCLIVSARVMAAFCAAFDDLHFV